MQGKVLGIVLLVMGAPALFFTLLFLLLISFFEKRDSKAFETWVKTPCSLSEVTIAFDKKPPRSELPFELKVVYDYELNGTAYSGDRYWVKPKKDANFEKLALIRREMLGSDALQHCYVNPDNPKESVLHQTNPSGKAIWFFLIPALFGLIMVGAGIASIRNSGPQMSGDTIAGLIGLIFLLTGLGIFYPTGILRIKQSIEISNWVETPCEIVWSRVVRKDSSDSDSGPSYREDIFYKYEYEGDVHHNSRYTLMRIGTGSSKRKNKIIKQYPRRSQHLCFVNPEIPEQAILNPKAKGWIWFMAFPLVFILVGGALIRYWWVSRRNT
ncbi:MAG: DUF3592 domain-containing protein [Verrucomicrobiota bacterium]